MSNYEKVSTVVAALFFVFVMMVGVVLLLLRVDPGVVLGIGVVGLIGTAVVYFIKSRNPAKRPSYDIFE